MKEKIILATLDLASKYGLGSLSMSQIAEAVGIKKPSLYNHFASKEELIAEMYQFIREATKQNLGADIEYGKLLMYDAEAILSMMTDNYLSMVSDENMSAFYKVIYAERGINSAAAKILVDETNKMVAATEGLFTYLSESDKMHFDDIHMAATSFALSIHSLIDYQLDCQKAGGEFDVDTIKRYINWFCKQYK